MPLPRRSFSPEQDSGPMVSNSDSWNCSPVTSGCLVIRSQPVACARVLFEEDGRASSGSHLVEIRKAPFQAKLPKSR
jgi:hypothetical protein